MSDVSIEQLAALLDLSSTAVTSHARRGILVRSAAKGQRGKFVLELSVRRYCQHLREQASGIKQGDAPAKERQRLAKAMADSVEQKNRDPGGQATRCGRGRAGMDRRLAYRSRGRITDTTAGRCAAGTHDRGAYPRAAAPRE
jgi:hypothetical protein